MQDGRERTIDYLRVSITDRCNLRCRYCMPEDLPQVSHRDVLSYEEILRLCGVASTLGMRTIKVTGGEPLARLGCVDLLRSLKALPGIDHVTLTTNGVLLEPLLPQLADIGISGINISLDTLDPELYRQLTGRDEFARVWGAVHAAVDAGLRVKLNCVPLRGLNENELVPLASLAKSMPICVRFIELMPTGFGEQFQLISGGEVLAALEAAFPGLSPDEKKRGFGPAHYYRSPDMRGSIGLIGAMSGGHFCEGCNRVRLTSEGFLKLCLYHDDGVDLRAMLREGASNEAIAAAMAAAIRRKPERHDFDKTDAAHGIRNMSRIGG